MNRNNYYLFILKTLFKDYITIFDTLKIEKTSLLAVF